MSDLPTYVYRDAMGAERAIQSDQGVPLTDDEIVAKGKAHFGDHAVFVRKVVPLLPLTPFQQQVAPALGGTHADTSTEGLPAVTPEERDTSWRYALEAAGLLASMLPAVGGARAATGLARLTGVGANVPRLMRFLGMTLGGTAAGATQPLVAGRPQDVESGAYWGTALGALGGGAATLAGAAARHGPGALRNVGDTMAQEIERVGGSQTPVLKGLNTGESLVDWATSKFLGQKGLDQLYERAKTAVAGALPPEVATIKAHQAAMASPAVAKWKRQATAIAQQLGGSLDDPTVQQIIEQTMGPNPTPGLRVPALSSTPLSYEEALQELKTLGRSWGRDARAAGVQEARASWMDGWDQLREALAHAGVPSSAITDFDTMRRQYKHAIMWKTLLEGGSHRQLIPLEAQKALAQNRDQIERLAGSPQEFNTVADVVLRGLTGRPHPVTGATVPSVRSADVPGVGLSRHVRGYAIQGAESGLPAKLRFGLAVPNAPWWTKYQAAPGRLPLEISPEGRDLLAVLANLGRAEAISRE